MAKKGKLGRFITDLFARAFLGLSLSLPYRWRVPLMGWIMSRIVAPLAGYRRRIRRNLAYIYPDLPKSEVRRICREVPDNVGRSLIEIYSGAEFAAHVKDTPIEGPGLAEMEKARAAGRPILLVTGHIGNYDVPRAELNARGFQVGAIYRRMRNPYFNSHYERAIAEIAEPIYPHDRRGVAKIVRFLADGGTFGILIDNRINKGFVTDFLGKPAPTTTSPAEMALKHDALLLSVYGIRQPDGMSFKIILNAPIPHTTIEEMTRVMTEELEEQVLEHTGQWLWIHNRWVQNL